MQPTDPPAGESCTGIRIWEKQVDEYIKRDSYLEENLKTVYSLMWGQCTDIMRQHLDALDALFAIMSDDGDGLSLLMAIKSQAFNFQSQKYLPHALHESLKRLYNCYQAKHMTTQMYLEQLQTVVDVIQHCSGSIGKQPRIADMVADEEEVDITKIKKAELDVIKKDAQEQYLAVAFLFGAHQNRFSRLVENLENYHVQGQDNYARTVTGAYNLLTNWKQDAQNAMRFMGPLNDGVSFCHKTDDKGISLINIGNKNKLHITCHQCKKKGHYANECKTKLDRKGSG
jgi:hypothetical protein